VPVIRFDHLTAAQKRAYVIADNKIAEAAGWDYELLAGSGTTILALRTPAYAAKLGYRE
jgi:hypothetical protein